MRRALCYLLFSLFLIGCDQAEPGKAQAQTAEQQLPEQVAELPPAQLTAAEESEVDSMVLPVPPAWIGDLDGMRASRTVRILVPYSKTFYQVDRGQQQGIAYEYGKALEKWLNQHRPFPEKSQRWQVMLIPTARNELLPKLVAGYGDLAAGGLTITEGRLKTVDFMDAAVSNVREAIVTGPGAPPISKLEDLAGQEVYVRPSSSYFEHLVELNKRFKAEGLEPVKIMPANENLETEDLLQMVNAGLFGITVADSYIAELWQPLYTDMVIHDGFYLNEGGQVSYAIRKNSPQLKAALNEFGKQHKAGSEFGNIMLKRYIKNSKRVLNATSEAEMQKFNALAGLFEKHAGTYDFDHLMLMAQGFQESQLDQAARSRAGAVGVMQLLPSTAADPAVGISGIDKSADKNIEAGSKYLRLLSDTYLDDPELTPVNRTLLSFAAYNAGPGNLMKFRRLAKKSGLDPNVWFGNVEQAAARIVGRETVDYVGNIYKYYVVYKLAEEKLAAREKARQN
ncbi:lytic transglycosylase F [Pseudomonas sp. N040]|uniref:transglycosylase SLT domain-containing protein n=1 Tax=Pseudomonas sp. N040 TaxID=2785325 RepID=UPI0018A26F6C|nr:lytic transglycosylase F [Pseudomonas sp. N040]MBF7730208.1 lytic transglycosylase F [Pseudomonas sp. N040]MBW7013850.1 lytic transglycosylase F [Pseudomonas sp. N040]